MNGKRIIIALLIAAIAATSFSWGAQASSGVTDKSDPNCKPLDSNTSNEIILCNDKVTIEVDKSGGVFAALEPASEDLKLPNAPHVNFLGPAMTIRVVDSKGQPVKAAFIKICYNDNNKGNIYRWWTAADWKTWYKATASARWFYSTTSHDIKGKSCTTTWLPGTFTIN